MAEIIWRFTRNEAVCLLMVGDSADCEHAQPYSRLSVVHACKSPCHQRAVGYRGSLPKTHPHYLFKEDGSNLYLNMIDPPVPLFMPETFLKGVGFIHRELHRGRDVLIHCNQGKSRSPSIAMLYLAAIEGLPNASWAHAVGAFQMHVYPQYLPGEGIMKFMDRRWYELLEESRKIIEVQGRIFGDG